jgi:hypothetical protein
MPNNKLVSIGSIVATVAVVSGLAYGVRTYGVSSTGLPANGGTMTFKELQTMLGPEKGANVKSVTCRTASIVAPNAVDILVELKEPPCTKIVPQVELPLVDKSNPARAMFPHRQCGLANRDIVKPANAGLVMIIQGALRNNVLFRMDPPAPLVSTKPEVAKTTTTYEDVVLGMRLAGADPAVTGPVKETAPQF